MGETADRLVEVARRGGLKSLWDSGLQHVLRGESTIDELLRLVETPTEDPPVATVAPPRRTSGLATGVRAVDEGAAPVEPLDDNFELLEEPKLARRSGATAVSLGKVLLVDDEDSLRKA